MAQRMYLCTIIGRNYNVIPYKWRNCSFKLKSKVFRVMSACPIFWNCLASSEDYQKTNVSAARRMRHLVSIKVIQTQVIYREDKIPSKYAGLH